MTTVMKTDEELMREYQQQKKEQKEQSAKFDNFYLFIVGDGAKAVIAPLINFPQLTQCHLMYHEKYDHTAGKWVADNVCAAQFGKRCKFCEEAKAMNDKKLKPFFAYFLPVYLHSVTKPGPDGKPVVVTFKDELGVEQPVKGFRMYRLKASVMDQLESVFEADEYSNIMAMNFVITRKGEGLDTKYFLAKLPRVYPINERIPDYSIEKVISDVRLHREEQAIEEPEEAEQEQITVEQALDMKEPTPAQLKSIENLKQLLGITTGYEPISWGQAQNMISSLRADYLKASN